MANFYTYMSDGTMNLSAICTFLSCNKSDLVTLNSQEYSSGLTVGQFLQQLDLKGSTLPKGLEFRVPVGLTGGVNTRYSSHSQLSSLVTTIDGKDTKYNVSKSYENLARTNTLEDRRGTDLSGLASNYTTGKDFNCYFSILADGSVTYGPKSLPVYPNEFSDSNSSNFSPQSLLGRSVDYQVYQGSSRNVSFTLSMHEELCRNYDEIHSIVAAIESACYPQYSTNIVKVPEIMFNIGSQFKVRGILTGCSASWKAPIIDGKLVNCDLAINITETTGPYSQSQVRSSGGRRG